MLELRNAILTNLNSGEIQFDGEIRYRSLSFFKAEENIDEEFKNLSLNKFLEYFKDSKVVK